MSQGEFIVSALKYRPSDWDQVVGQSSITSTLKNAIEKEEIAKAYLFCGPRGVGKTTSARIFAKAINEKYLGQDQDLSFNVFELDAASNNSVDDIRHLIDQVRIQPPVGKYKVYVIDEVHMLSSQAFNAFLKTLEEPPPHAIFILATTEKHKVIPTILSRCQIYDFSRIQVKDMTAHLARIAQDQGVTFEEEALHLIAQKADGALRDALSIFDQMVSFSGKHLNYTGVAENLNILDYDYFFRIGDAVQRGNVKDALLVHDEIISQGFDSLLFITGLAGHLRDLLVASDEVTVQLLDTTAGVKERYIQQSKVFATDRIIAFLDILQSAEIQYRTTQNKRLLTEISLLKMCQIQGLSDAPATEKKSKNNNTEPATGGPVDSSDTQSTMSPNDAEGAPPSNVTDSHTSRTEEAQVLTPSESEPINLKSAEKESVSPASTEDNKTHHDTAVNQTPINTAPGALHMQDSAQDTSSTPAFSVKEGSPSPAVIPEPALTANHAEDGSATVSETEQISLDAQTDVGSKGASPEPVSTGSDISPMPPMADQGATTPAADASTSTTPARPASPAQEVKTRKIKGSISIVDLDDDENEEEQDSTEEELIAGDAITESALLKAWKAYADIIKSQRKFSFHSTLNNRNPSIIDANTIHITLENEVQMEDLNMEKAELMSFLREQVNNPALSLEAEIKEDLEDVNISLQTPREQFKHMIKKNPHLGEMTKRFDLDVDY